MSGVARRISHVLRVAAVVAGCGVCVVGRGQDGPGGDADPAGSVLDDGTLQQQLASPDDEWAVLRPLIVRVLQLRQAAGVDRPDGGGGSDDGAGSGAGQMTPAGDPVARMAALRAARARAAADLAVAERDLTDLLTARQEATLVVAGVLD